MPVRIRMPDYLLGFENTYGTTIVVDEDNRIVNPLTETIRKRKVMRTHSQSQQSDSNTQTRKPTTSTDKKVKVNSNQNKNYQNQKKEGQSQTLTQKKTGSSNTTSNSGKKLSETVGKIEGKVETVSQTVQTMSGRITKRFAPTFSSTYPQRTDMYMYGVDLNPVGQNGSSLRSYFDSAYSSRILADIRTSLRYSPSTPITATHVANYVNVISTAFQTFLALYKHYNLCYNSKGKRTLQSRFDNIYDPTIPSSMLKLARTLRQCSLPPKITSLIRMLTNIYTVDNTPDAPFIQILPYGAGYDSETDVDTLISAQISAINSLTNFVELNTAFENPKYPGRILKMSTLSISEMTQPEDLLISKSISVKYSDSFMDIWSNLPLEAADGVPTTHRHTYTNDETTIYQSSFGKDFSKLSNGLVPYYNVASTLYEPGMLKPYNTSLGAGNNNLFYVGSAGGDVYVDIANVNSIIHGNLCRNGNNIYDTTNTLRSPTPGSVVVTTMGIHKLSDSSQILEDLMM